MKKARTVSFLASQDHCHVQKLLAPHSIWQLSSQDHCHVQMLVALYSPSQKNPLTSPETLDLEHLRMSPPPPLQHCSAPGSLDYQQVSPPVQGFFSKDGATSGREP